MPWSFHGKLQGRWLPCTPQPESSSTDTTDLGSVPPGESVRISCVAGGHHVLSRLASLGFTPGARLQVVQNFGRGPLIVTLRDTRVALGRGEAIKIVVERLKERR